MSMIRQRAELFKIFARDATKAAMAIDEIYKKSDSLSNLDLKSYITTVHAMKSALALVGEKELSQTASRLEQAGRNQNIAEILSETPAFLISLRAAVKRLKPPEENILDHADEDIAFINEKLLVIANACKLYDKREAKETIGALRQETLRHKTLHLLNTLSEYLLHSDFEEAADAIREFLEVSEAE